MKPRDSTDILELKNTPTTPKPRPNPYCLSKEQIDRICGYFAYLPDSPEPHAIPTKHCNKVPALRPAELEYLVTLLVPFYTPSPGPEAPFMCWHRPVNWRTVTAKFDDRFPRYPPRKKQVLMCAMYGNFYRVVIAIFREKCIRAHAGEDNAGSFSTLTSSELDRLFTIYYDRWRVQGYGIRLENDR